MPNMLIGKSASSSVKEDGKGTWNAFLSTDTGLDFFEAYRIYSMRWAIEVCFSEMKGLFNQTINGTMELSVTERIWDLILQIVSAIADLFSADEEAIIRMIANDNEKIAIIKKLCTEKNTA